MRNHKIGSNKIKQKREKMCFGDRIFKINANLTDLWLALIQTFQIRFVHPQTKTNIIIIVIIIFMYVLPV